MVSRNVKSEIDFLTSKYPVVALTGPRQSGKTTVLKTIFKNYRYVSLENPDVRNFIQTDPKGFFEEYDKYVIFDEAQRSPELFSYLQTMVDESGIMGQFIISGSQNFHLMENITQSLAGRVAIFRLFPFDNQELKSANLLSDDYLEMMIKGFYPAIYDRDIPSKTFYSNYIQTYVQRDVSELISVKDLRLFQNFLSLCATRAGQLLNLNELARDCGISQPTAKGWLSALESGYIVFQLQPYFKNYSKRIVKTPKLYFYDTGLLCHLLKIHKREQLIMNPVKGCLFENMMISEYIKRMYHKNNVEDVWFWRDSHGKEIDFMVETSSDELQVIEMKASSTILSDMFNNINYFTEISSSSEKRTITRQLVYAGNYPQKRTAEQIIPWLEFGR